MYDKAFCPNADVEETNIYTSAEVKKIEKKNEDFLRYIAIKSGYQPIPMPFQNLWFLFDPLNSEVKFLIYFFLTKNIYSIGIKMSTNYRIGWMKKRAKNYGNCTI